jgi:hypothetical protein
VCPVTTLSNESQPESDTKLPQTGTHIGHCVVETHDVFVGVGGEGPSTCINVFCRKPSLNPAASHVKSESSTTQLVDVIEPQVGLAPHVVVRVAVNPDPDKI